MSAYTQILTVNWGESDPFGLVYYAREVAWFNEIEHELFRQIGHPINRMINQDRSAFVMGEIQFRFVGPAAYGDRVECTLTLLEIRAKTVHWHCNAVNLRTGPEGYQDTLAFLDRRIANVMEFEKIKARARAFAKDLPDPAKILGKMRYPDGHKF